MSTKTQITVIRTLIEYTRRVADPTTLQDVASGPGSYRLLTTMPDGKPLNDETIAFADDRAYMAAAQARGAADWDHRDILEVEGI